MADDEARDLVQLHGSEKFGFLHIDWEALWQELRLLPRSVRWESRRARHGTDAGYRQQKLRR